jgi:hypothetical protein
MSFLAADSLAIQRDIPFDISDLRLVMMRTLLGASFGCILSLPNYHAGLKSFGHLLDNYHDVPPAHAAMLLAPFVLGFSSGLAKLVFSRFVAGQF